MLLGSLKKIIAQRIVIADGIRRNKQKNEMPKDLQKMAESLAAKRIKNHLKARTLGKQQSDAISTLFNEAAHAISTKNPCLLEAVLQFSIDHLQYAGLITDRNQQGETLLSLVVKFIHLRPNQSNNVLPNRLCVNALLKKGAKPESYHFKALRSAALAGNLQFLQSYFSHHRSDRAQAFSTKESYLILRDAINGQHIEVVQYVKGILHAHGKFNECVNENTWLLAYTLGRIAEQLE